jgi:hypothetical protein
MQGTRPICRCRHHRSRCATSRPRCGAHRVEFRVLQDYGAVIRGRNRRHDRLDWWVAEGAVGLSATRDWTVVIIQVDRIIGEPRAGIDCRGWLRFLVPRPARGRCGRCPVPASPARSDMLGFCVWLQSTARNSSGAMSATGVISDCAAAMWTASSSAGNMVCIHC